MADTHVPSNKIDLSKRVFYDFVLYFLKSFHREQGHKSHLDAGVTENKENRGQ